MVRNLLCECESVVCCDVAEVGRGSLPNPALAWQTSIYTLS